MTQTLLVPLDGSQLAEAALPLAARLARSRDFSLTLLRVTPVLPDFFTSEAEVGFSADTYELWQSAARGEATGYLDRVRSSLDSQGLEVQTIVRRGTAADTILDVADEVGAYAITMATHGRTGLGRLAMGSVAQQVLAHSVVPVLLARQKPDRSTPADGKVVPGPSLALRRLLVPLDGSPLSEAALEFACDLADRDSMLLLVRVVEPLQVALGADGGPVILDERGTQELVTEAEEYLARQAQALNRAGLSTITTVRVGYIGREILSVARQEAAQLIVMSTHARTGLARWVLGSTADYVARHSEAPAFLVSTRALVSRMTGPFQVRDLMTREVESVRPSDTLISAAHKLLRRQASGAPVVNEDGALVGVITEHDLLAWHARYVGSIDPEEGTLDPTAYTRRLQSDTVSSIMSRPPVSVEESAPLIAAVQLLLERGIRRLPVTRHGQLVGILSRTDIIQGIAQRAAEPVSEVRSVT